MWHAASSRLITNNDIAMRQKYGNADIAGIAMPFHKALIFPAEAIVRYVSTAHEMKRLADGRRHRQVADESVRHR